MGKAPVGGAAAANSPDTTSTSGGLVASKELVKALVAYAEAEPDETRKAAATIAIMNIRAITE
jgi:hypothetical protein